MVKDGLARTTINGLRRVLHTVFARARRCNFERTDPIDEVEKLSEPKRAYVTLRAEEVSPLLASVPDAWRGLFAAALYTGMRKGELLGCASATSISRIARSPSAARTRARPPRAGMRTRFRSQKRWRRFWSTR